MVRSAFRSAVGAPRTALSLPAALLLLAAAPAPVIPGAPLGFADTVDLALAAPIVAHLTILSADRLGAKDAPGIPAGTARYYLTAHVDALIRGPALPVTVTYLADVPLDARGRAPKLKGADALVFAAPVPQRDGELRLIAPDANRPWDAGIDQTVRAVLAQSLSPDAPPAITGIGNVFHVPGSLPGESETQIFVRTASARPISLAVERRPGAEPSWAVALGDIIDEAAAPPPPRSLLWYRLACGLPPHLPAASTASLSAEDAQAAAADYAVVLRGLGACGRTRGGASAQEPGSDERVMPTDAQSG